MEIRYSVECGAAWARIWHSRIGDRIEVSAPGGPARTAKVADTYDAQEYLFTPMVAVNTGDRVRGCLEPTGGHARECFMGTVGRALTPDLGHPESLNNVAASSSQQPDQSSSPRSRPALLGH
jgi:hypothetical protein